MIEEKRREYHRKLCTCVLGFREGIPTNADKKSKTSTRIARALASMISRSAGVELREIDAKPQELGGIFTTCTREFLEETFKSLDHARPGPWDFDTSQARLGIARYEPYIHLAALDELVKLLESKNPALATAFERDYLIIPDIVIARRPWPDEEINRGDLIIIEGDEYARYSPFRKKRDDQPSILHASISCKWTLRSDRAQNARTEALNLIRNRKGRTPHIVVVTGEPLPTRIASIALGTGDIDCVYHVALLELRQVIREAGNEDQADMLDQLVEGSRLRDISDLPLDLAI
ncbi:NgoMIV family type II restriction endonuclease [Ammonifex thiophilus]|uniref:NgoMIV family type II restriction endonuclease n=1 Tax=Ammonifex thiophilus TaxID=444093 RepID=UPI00196BA079|nr:NgoMIV family type II restriction endonuclease [Ammonifex thiophilus]